MVVKSRKRLGYVTIVAASAVVIAAASIVAATVSSAKPSGAGAGLFKDGRYIVVFADVPVLGYDGGVAGFAATKPAKGKKVDPGSAAVKSWQRHLVGKHDAALRSVGASSKIYDYTVALNGMAADLTGAQAAKLSKSPDVVSIELDTLRQPDTTLSPEFLGLTDSGSLWDQLEGQENAGAGIVVGVVDTGIWPESPSFANDRVRPRPAGWHGTCRAGENFPVSVCGNKLVGARYYVDAFGKKDVADEDYLSPRDFNGHGSHTSSTAAGHAGIDVVIDGTPIGTASGMAPGAAIAAYKACWEGRPGVPGGCATGDLVAAIDQAVLDGVDVINFSIGGGSESSVLDPVEVAFLFAADAGIFVSASAGNNGPGVSTLDHPSPWLTTVAATTFRTSVGVVELGNSNRLVGVSNTATVPTQTPLITGTAGSVAGAPPEPASWCANGTLDPAKVAGKIVVCVRGGVIARVESSAEAKRAGAVGMVLVNANANQSLNGDYHFVPTVHLNSADGDVVEAYAAIASPTAALVEPTPGEVAAAPDVPAVASFSSRGPSTTTGGDILKPDIAAPGVDVVAAVAPPGNSGRSFDFYSGTSMASPHVAGIGALLSALHPDWTPAEIKSALQTTAGPLAGTTSVFDHGAGFVDPNGAGDPGLVYPAGFTDWLRYLQSVADIGLPPNLAISGTQLNQASIAAGKVPGTVTVPRRVRNVGNSTATYTASVSLPGFTATVSPATLTIPAGGTASFEVTFTVDGAPLGEYAIGDLTWTDGTHEVRSPIALRPVSVDAPTEVEGVSADGSTSFAVTPGFSGTLVTTEYGLVPGETDSGTLAAGPFAFFTDDGDTDWYRTVLTEDVKALRFSLDTADDTTDFDLFVVVNESDPVHFSATAAADEEVTLYLALEPGDIVDVFVNAFAGTSAYTLTSYFVPAAAGSLTATDPAVTQLVPATVTASWPAGDTGFGLIEYSDGISPADSFSFVTVS